MIAAAPTFSTVSLLSAAIVGFLAGTHAAIWGMYKDAIHEGFTFPRFFRSSIIGAVMGVLVQIIFGLPLPQPGALLLCFGLAYGAERGVVEVWKTFIRHEDQSKYFIPMQFAVFGKPVAGRGMRLFYGVLYVAAVAALLLLVGELDKVESWSSTLRAGIAGAIMGTIVAIGGAWKDAPKEGFDPLKFPRSPLMTIAFALLFSRLTASNLQIAVAAFGLERGAVETYKTFFFPSKPRGKFAGKPILFPEMLVRRRYFVPAYVAIWIGVLVSAVLAAKDL